MEELPINQHITASIQACVRPLMSALIVCTMFTASAAELKLEFVEYAPGLFVHIGKHEEMSVAGLGDIANIGFIVGTESVAVIDPGGSPEVGKAMRLAIREIANLPVSHVILTHIHPDHIFGSGAFADAKFIVAHRNFSRALAQRGDFYRNAFKGLFTDNEYPTSLQPTLVVDDEILIDLGGRQLTVKAHRTAHTDNDLSVFDLSTRTLWASDLIFVERIPSLDGSLTGWLKTMEVLSALNAELVIPGHGLPAAWSVVAEPQQRYLSNILREIRQYILQNKKLSDAVENIAAEEHKNWRLFDRHHRGNVTKAYTELEWE